MVVECGGNAPEGGTDSRVAQHAGQDTGQHQSAEMRHRVRLQVSVACHKVRAAEVLGTPGWKKYSLYLDL